MEKISKKTAALIGAVALTIALAAPGAALAAGWQPFCNAQDSCPMTGETSACMVAGGASACPMAEDSDAAVACPMAGSEGVCSTKCEANNACANYVDVNGDGVCDNRLASADTPCASFTDANQNGMCDNWESRTEYRPQKAVDQGRNGCGMGCGPCGMDRGMCGAR